MFAFRAIYFILARYLTSTWTPKKMRLRGSGGIGVALPLAGVAVGVAAFVVVLSVMGGLVKNLQARLLSLEAHIEIVKDNTFDLVDANPEILSLIKNTSPDILSIQPFQRGDAILQANGRASTIVLTGISNFTPNNYISKYTKLGNMNILSQPLKPQNIPQSEAFPGVIVGNQVLFHMALDVGTRATLISVMEGEGPAGLAPKQYPIVVADELQSGNPAIDSKIVYSNLEFANSFFGTEGTWSGIQLRVRSPFAMDNLVSSLNSKLKPLGLRAKPWTEANRTLVRALKLERWGVKFVMFIVILVACFSITITLVLAVRRKVKEMAIMRALGLRQKDLGVLFLLHGALIGFLGVVIGLIIGFSILKLIELNLFTFITSSYSNKPLPILIDWYDITLVSVGSIVLAVVASLWPAWAVMRIDVIDTLSERG